MGIPQDEGLRPYFQAKIEELEHLVRDKAQNLRRLEAQRNEINSKGQDVDRARTGRGVKDAPATRR
eukprot:jgi/Pico_ML_1/54852/g710.t1